MRSIYIYTVVISSIIFNISAVFGQDVFDDLFQPKTNVGGYGELHYNYQKNDDSDPKKSLDFHRFVLFFSHSWTEKWSFRSEVELEHNFVKDSQGELELEQAFINYYHAPFLSFQAGVMLAASGLINEFHEPVVFLSVERPEYAKSIIPTTWFGNGVGITGFWSGLDYRFVIMEGLDGSKISASSAIRSGRQKGYKANANELMYNTRIDYVDIPGLRVGGSFLTNNAVVDDSTNNRVNLWEVHARYRANGIHSTFEYGNISYGNGDLKASRGYYFDLGYDVGQFLDCEGELIPWLRWSNYNTAAETSMGGDSQEQFNFNKWLVGLTFLPIKDVVFKVDYGERERQLDGQKTKLFNLGMGYNF